MHADKLLIVAQGKRKPGWGWEESAGAFYSARNDVLRKSPSGLYTGRVSMCCIPLKGYTDRELDVNEMLGLSMQFDAFINYRNEEPGKRGTYWDKSGLTVLFRKLLVHPPYLLDDNWDGEANARRLRAQKIIEVCEKKKT